jgi:hypothetical protein
MSEPTLRDLTHDISTELRQYVEKRIQLAKFSAFEKSALASGSGTVVVLLSCTFLLAWIFGMVSLALYLNALLQTAYAGFGLIALFHLLLAGIVFIMRNTIQLSVAEKVAQQLLGPTINNLPDESAS